MTRVYGYDFPAGVPLGTDYELAPRLALGMGLGLHRARQDLSVFDIDRSLTEDFKATGIIPFVTFRGQVDMDLIKLRVDQSFSLGDWGDYTDLYWDGLYTLRWEAAPSVDLLVGLRHLQLSAEGKSGGNDYEVGHPLLRLGPGTPHHLLKARIGFDTARGGDYTGPSLGRIPGLRAGVTQW